MSKKNLFPFSLSLRNNIYYVRFKNSDETSQTKYLNAKSTGETNYENAVKQAWQMYFNDEHKKQSLLQTFKKEYLSDNDIENLMQIAKDRGIIKSYIKSGSKQDIILVDFLTDFWDINKSEYIREKRRMNKHVGIEYCRESRNQILRHWKPYFKNMLLGELTKGELKEFVLYLQDLPQSSSTKKHIYRAGATAIKWAFNNELIEKDFTAGIIGFSDTSKERKILTKEIAECLFSIKWKDEKSMLGNMLAMLTGMRLGEILALRLLDIGENCVYVQHSWNETEGLKTPKNGEARIVYFPFPQIIKRLKKLAYMNPFDSSINAFVFWGTLPGKPIANEVFIKKFREELQTIGFTKEDAKQYCFHSWRHFYTAYMIDFVNQRALQSQTGHKTVQMLEHYSKHPVQSDIEQIQNAQIYLFGSIVNKSYEITLNENKLYYNVKNEYMDKTQYFVHSHQQKLMQN